MSALHTEQPPAKGSVSPKAFFIVAAIGLTAFLLGMSLVGTAYNRIAPYYLFGKQATEQQNIHVVMAARHFLVFSNDPSQAVARSKLGALNFSAVVARCLTIPGLFCIFIYPTLRVLKKRNPALAREIMVLFRHAD